MEPRQVHVRVGRHRHGGGGVGRGILAALQFRAAGGVPHDGHRHHAMGRRLHGGGAGRRSRAAPGVALCGACRSAPTRLGRAAGRAGHGGVRDGAALSGLCTLGVPDLRAAGAGHAGGRAGNLALGGRTSFCAWRRGRPFAVADRRHAGGGGSGAAHAQGVAGLAGGRHRLAARAGREPEPAERERAGHHRATG
ncbi:hypothetical protein SDC9_148554 [bioreactor metagenome]|uniref:Uncharacterized protein n=1 Tax=bioreactor metagenome TaxID=1076179 RepID=A0A645EH51_9ZZZZ